MKLVIKLIMMLIGGYILYFLYTSKRLAIAKALRKLPIL